MIRQVGSDADERNALLQQHAEALRAEGIPLCLVADAAQAAQLAVDLKLCDEQTVAEVGAELGDS